jgi:hemerythrin-like domain-containing protein
MYSIELLVEEHNNILRFNKVFRKVCTLVLRGEKVDTEDFRNMIDFVRNYADKHHHGKEEQILFKEMQLHLGAIGNKLITNGMLVEHDLGRLFIAELETAVNQYEETPDENNRLDIIANAIGYTKLLQRHIDKENDVVYTYAEKNLPKEVLEDVEMRAQIFEKEAEDKKTQEYYLTRLEEWETKYKNI